MNIKLLTEHHLEFLSLKGGCTDLSGSKRHTVGNHMSWLLSLIGIKMILTLEKGHKASHYKIRTKHRTFTNNGSNNNK